MTSPEVLIPAAAGLLGALIGGAASLLATRSENKHAIRMLRLQRREQAADDALGVLWQVITISNEPDDKPAGDILDPKAVVERTYDLANRSAGDEPHLQRLCHDYAYAANAQTPWKQYRLMTAALSGAITDWRTDPKSFAKRRTFDEYVTQLAAERAAIDAAEAED